MGFWDNVAGSAPQQQPAQARQEPVRNSPQPWWAPAPPQQAQPQVQAIPQPEMNEDEAEWNGYVGSTQPKKALSRLKHDRCPSCDSTNYGQPQGHPNAVAQCYECGYNPRFHQETSALPSNGGPIQATKQVSTANNWNPQGIVGNVNSV